MLADELREITQKACQEKEKEEDELLSCLWEKVENVVRKAAAQGKFSVLIPTETIPNFLSLYKQLADRADQHGLTVKRLKGMLRFSWEPKSASQEDSCCPCRDSSSPTDLILDQVITFVLEEDGLPQTGIKYGIVKL
jgi:hypothetical protein